MSFPTHRKLLIFSVAATTLTSAIGSAKFEQKMLSINPNDKKVTFTFYHFDSSKSATLIDIVDNLGKTAMKKNNTAAISASAQATFAYQSGKFIFSQSTAYFINNGNIVNPATSPRSSKYTFILTDEKNRHAIGYAPIVSEDELGHALKQYLSTNITKYTTAVIIDSGNQCGFYKNNGKYNPYYLKELKKPAKALTVK
jgi:hypothetical protein